MDNSIARILLLLLLLALPPALLAEEPTLARLSFWLPPERMDEFAAVYAEQTAAGARGAEAEEDLLGQMDYQSKQHMPDRADLTRAIAVLQREIDKNPTSDQVPRLQFLIGQCHEHLKHPDQARAIYKDLATKYPHTPWAAKAQQALKALAADTEQ